MINSFEETAPLPGRFAPPVHGTAPKSRRQPAKASAGRCGHGRSGWLGGSCKSRGRGRGLERTTKMRGFNRGEVNFGLNSQVAV